MKVSFGQGVPARVSWISFLAPEMQTSNGFYPVYLFYKKENKLVLAYGISETSEYPQTWPSEVVNNHKKITEYIDNPPRYGDSFLFKSYVPNINSNKVSITNFPFPILDIKMKSNSNNLDLKIQIHKKNYYLKCNDNLWLLNKVNKKSIYKYPIRNINISNIENLKSLNLLFLKK